jgi:glycosyltransferase involved in cell wall biosynthesis
MRSPDNAGPDRQRRWVALRRYPSRVPTQTGLARSAISSATVDVVIPVFNEERRLPRCIALLDSYLQVWFPFDWTIIIADNASTDGTAALARRLASQHPRVQVLSLDRKGKGHALRCAWLASRADIVAYMDVDLSTGLDALLPLIAPLISGHSDIAVGSRLAPGARRIRSAKRDVISRCYNVLVRLLPGVWFSDVQCGFKAARRRAVRPLLRHVKDSSWFFDTELLLLAHHNGLRVHEVPVDWVADDDSRVSILDAVVTNLRGLFRMALSRATGAATICGLPSRPALGPSCRGGGYVRARLAEPTRGPHRVAGVYRKGEQTLL